MSQTNPFECWAIVEVMGHKRYAGYVSEQSVAGASFVRIDVPVVEYCSEEMPGFTKLLGPGSIYAITPCTEETARAFAAQSGERAFATYEAPRLPSPESVVEKIERAAAADYVEHDQDEDDDDDVWEHDYEDEEDD